ncbi:atypical chemokine receptor 1 [Eublepharis macularius]|uniref:Atypical chemokine receptor 1 n=1 Tax=Eublepharis macularius TaxID=481883 RepID=A0AA97K4B4_EUBMA|nr:atypical chemokine receptor 1 [Eublepharis macularius]
MGNCFFVDQGLSLDIAELEDLLLFYEQNYSYLDEYTNSTLPEPCHDHYCSVFEDHVPAFLITLSILGLLSNVALGVALAKFPRLWDQHGPSKTVLSLMTVAAGIFAVSLPAFAVEWRFGDTFCKTAHVMRYGALFAQGLSVAGNSCLLLRASPSWLFPMALWLVGFLFSVPTAMISNSGDGKWAVCALSSEAKLYPWSMAHTIICLADFLLLPVFLGLAKLTSRCCECNRRPHIDLTWLFYLFWAPYGVAMILKTLVQEQLLRPSCHLQEALNYFLGLSEGLGMLHCALCPLFLMGEAICHQKTARAGKR